MNSIENETPAKLRGGYYTDPQIARFLARWVLGIDPRRLLEPGCGDGVFIEAVNQADSKSPISLTAFEVDPREANKARQKISRPGRVKTDVITEDFLEWSLSQADRKEQFDGALGNPPFIRYQYLTDAQQAVMQRVFDLFDLPFTRHTNAWVPFVILSLARLRPGGRLAMVVPSEILHVLYAESLREYLFERCSKILIIDPAELWFTETLQGVVLLLAEKKTSREAEGRGVAIAQVKDRKFFEDDPELMFDRVEYSKGDALTRKWMRALLTEKERELLKRAAKRPGVFRFREIADVDVGIVTGANKFFLVPDSVVSRYELHDWAHPMFGRSEHVRGVIYDEESHSKNRRAGLPANFLWFGPRELKAFPKSVREYILEGEAQNLQHRYKCRIRSPWYNVPSVSTAPVAMLKRSHDYARLILNRAGVYTTDTAYRIRPLSVEPERLVHSFVNSLTALTAELEGRHYGGGVLELVPSEIERLLVPLSQGSENLIERLDKLIRDGESPDTIFPIQDETLLSASGLNRQEREALFCAWNRLRMRRQRKAADERGLRDESEISNLKSEISDRESDAR